MDSNEPIENKENSYRSQAKKAFSYKKTNFHKYTGEWEYGIYGTGAPVDLTAMGTQLRWVRFQRVVGSQLPMQLNLPVSQLPPNISPSMLFGVIVVIIHYLK